MLTYPKYSKLLPQRPEGYQNQAELQGHLQMYKRKITVGFSEDVHA